MDTLPTRTRELLAKAHTRLTQPSSWILPREESSIAPPGVWTNADYDPVEVERRTWTSTTIATYWLSDLVSIVGWSQAAAMYHVGLSATDATLACMVAGICISVPTVLSGSIGASLHVPFPVAIRASYGTYFRYFCVLSRGTLALFWFGIHSVYGSNCVTPVITAIWPSYAKLPSHLPPSARITTKGMVSYVVYHALQFPFLFVPPHKLKYLFRIKVVLLAPVVAGMAIWIAAKAHGRNGFFYQPSQLHGSERAWQCDWARFSKKPRTQWWQVFLIPFFLTTMGICDIVGASASRKLWREALWNPLSIVDKWNDTAGGRAAAFFCSAMWLLAQISINLSTNSVAYATDIGSLFPKWLNFRRASLLGFLIGGWALCPWIILKSAPTFLNFMSAYAVFMAPMTGTLICDHYLVHRRRCDVPALYNPRGIYFYKYGTNWRALVVTLVTIAPLLPGIANTTNSVPITAGARNLYTFNRLYCFFVSSASYYLVGKLWPEKKTIIPEMVPIIIDVSVDSPAEKGGLESGLDGTKGKQGEGV